MKFDEAHAFNLALRRLALRHRARAHELLAPLGLRPGQEFLLLELAEHGHQGQSELAHALACAPPSVSLMVGKLEAAGMVTKTRDSRDQRSVVVELTGTGRELADRLRALWIGLAEETVGEPGHIAPHAVAPLLDDMATNLRPASGEAVGA